MFFCISMLSVFIFGPVCLCPALGNMKLPFRFSGRQMWPRAGRVHGTVTSDGGKGESDVGEKQEDPDGQRL